MENKMPYDADYFERGIECGVSGYQNYRWLPELTTALAMAYVDYLGITREHKTLDFGCAKGYVVKALRILHRQAWGCDISGYAVNSTDNQTRQYLKQSSSKAIVPFSESFDFIISKDVLEHIPELELNDVLVALRNKGESLFAIIPLGMNGRYTIPAYELDVTHVLAKGKDWWIDKFQRNGWVLKEFSHRVRGIKESWSNYEAGNGFFLLGGNGSDA